MEEWAGWNVSRDVPTLTVPPLAGSNPTSSATTPRTLCSGGEGSVPLRTLPGREGTGGISSQKPFPLPPDFSLLPRVFSCRVRDGAVTFRGRVGVPQSSDSCLFRGPTFLREPTSNVILVTRVRGSYSRCPTASGYTSPSPVPSPPGIPSESWARTSPSGVPWVKDQGLRKDRWCDRARTGRVPPVVPTPTGVPGDPSLSFRVDHGETGGG